MYAYTTIPCYYENSTKDLYLIFLFEITSYLGGAALYEPVVENVTCEENKIERHLLKIMVENLKINKFCLVGVET
jgi:hypothetical protein